MSHHNHHVSDIELYEGDQSKLYSGVLNHHAHESVDSEGSKKKVKKIWMITLLLTIVTILEVSVGLWAYNSGMHSVGLIIYFLVLTVVKAYYIVKIFMHLGDEKNFFVWLVIGPLAFLLWCCGALIADGDHSLDMNETRGHTIEAKFK